MRLALRYIIFLMFLDSAVKNNPGFLQDQNKYATFGILANPSLTQLIIVHPKKLKLDLFNKT